MIFNIFLITTILIVWFNTDAFVEYATIFRLPLVKIKEYLQAKNKDCTITYHNFLLFNYNNFFVRLITCPICTSIWLSLILDIMKNYKLNDFPILFICSLLLYKMYNLLSNYENK